jgi:polysaccharide export outer membrane protein
MITASNKYLASGLMAALLMAGQAIGLAQGRGSATSTPASLGAGVTPVPGVAGVPVSPEYRIGPEDVLDIVVWGNADLTRSGVQVRPDGRISLPMVNDVQAAGLTPMDLRSAITKKLEPAFHDQEVSVVVREVNSMKISVVGAVRTPSRFPLRSELTVLDAIAMAGGFADFAKRDKIYVLRNGRKLAFNYDRFVKDPVVEDNFLLRAGDTVVIP